ncbi:coadhesin-like [Saccostrea cucullata]|uniref:coadhesin-like n=1 Tax=Saccostrea cuccullata TaxID=36930 RepID=UPI002ED2DECD
MKSNVVPNVLMHVYWWKTTYHSCNVKCTVWSHWGSWNGWGSCFGNSCIGQQLRSRSRKCRNPGLSWGFWIYRRRGCIGQSKQTSKKQCLRRVNGGWSSWGPWRTSGACSKTCGQGLILTTRERTCSNPRPRCYGKHCPGSSKVSFVKKCFVKHCIVNGGWGSWQTWSNYGTCSKTCGSGKKERHRERYCNNPVPKYGGAACHGRSKEKESAICNVQHCKVNGKWSGWGNWGHFRHCSETCGHGVRYRYRYRECNNPEPEHGGKKCPGSLRDEEFKRCFLRKCPSKTITITFIKINCFCL